MVLVAIAWLYVVLMIAAVEATGGSLLGAAATLLLYGVLPLAILGYLFFAPARRRARRAAEVSAAADTGADPDGGGHPPGDAVAPVREEP